MNPIDTKILQFVNQYSQQSWGFDKLVGLISDNNLVKGGVIILLVYWAWFKRADGKSRNREHVVATLLNSIFAVLLARGLALSLPFRLRPLHDDSVSFLLPYGIMAENLSGWSSFPSDHAVLFFTLSTGLFFIAREAGFCALVYTVLVILLPRVYLGLHYPTDILAGAALGVLIALIGNLYFVKRNYIRPIVNLSESTPHLFYPLFFLFTYQIADMFDTSRNLLKGAFKLALMLVT